MRFWTPREKLSVQGHTHLNLGSPVSWASLVAQMVKNLPANVGDHLGDGGSIPGLGRSPGEGNGYPLQYYCLENSMDRGAWWAIQSMGSQRVSYNWATNTFTFRWFVLSTWSVHGPGLGLQRTQRWFAILSGIQNTGHVWAPQQFMNVWS